MKINKMKLCKTKMRHRQSGLCSYNSKDRDIMSDDNSWENSVK